MSIKAYSYVRFSTLSQMTGDSLRRQKKLSKDYAEKHNLVLDTSIKMQDLGVSAFHGDNIASGALGGFLRAVNEGEIETGSYLLVESLDRISRDKVNIALELFLSILRKGIIIVTLADERKYVYDTLDTTELIISIMNMSRAHNESKIKSERITKAWENKIDNAPVRPVTKWIPAWLILSDGKIITNPYRTKLVQDMFQWVCDGLGTTLILKRLNEQNIAPWGGPSNINFKNSDNKKTRTPKRWYGSYIQRILTNKAVLGEYQPRQKSNSTHSPVIQNYYPTIIEKDIFYRVQEIRKSRNVTKGKGIGRRGEFVTNLFSGLLKCGYSQEKNTSNYKCAGKDSSMTVYSKGRKSKVKYLHCSRLREGGIGCDACKKLWRYDHFESSFIHHAKEIEIASLFGDDDDDKHEIYIINNKIETAKGQISALEKEAQKIIETFTSDKSIPRFITTHAHKIEKQKDNLQNEMKKYKKRLQKAESNLKNKSSSYKEFKKIILIIEKQNSQDNYTFRLKLAETLRQSIDSIDVYANGRVRTAKSKEFLKEHLSDEEYNQLDIENPSSTNFDPFFVVHYKTGHHRTIRTDRNDSTKLLLTTKWDNEFGFSEVISHGRNML